MKAGSCSSSSPGTDRRSGGEFRMVTSTWVVLTDTFCSSWLFGVTWRVEEVTEAFNLPVVEMEIVSYSQRIYVGMFVFVEGPNVFI